MSQQQPIRLLVDGVEHWALPIDDTKEIAAKRYYGRAELHVSEEGKGYYFNYDVAPQFHRSRSEADRDRDPFEGLSPEQLQDFERWQDAL